MATHDPLDVVNSLGWRVVWIEDFDHRVHLVDDISVALIDPRVERPAAASAVLSLLALPDPRTDLYEAS